MTAQNFDVNYEKYFDNESWATQLRSATGLPRVKFPASSEVQLGGNSKIATITMKEKGLGGNMQTDAAAFEAWAMSLLLHCGVQTVQIALEDGAKPEPRHYERFLYRLKRFSELYPDRVVVSWPNESSKALSLERNRVLNQPNPRRDITEDDAQERMKAVVNPAPSENALELALEISASFRSHFRLDRVMRQWPVGLFEESVARANPIFTGGKSGIDLIGIQGDTLFLFELKKDGNERVGAVSELLFYANVMRDALGDSAIFKFPSMGTKENCTIGPGDIVQCSKICAVLLAPRLHPLISEPRIFEALNSTAARRFGSDRPIRFQSTTISLPKTEDDDFTFVDSCE